MIDVGKKLFPLNFVQIILIILCMGMAIIAKHFSVNISGIPISTFIDLNFKYIFNQSHEYNLLLNILIPALLYMLSCFLLLGMAITNLGMLKQEENKIDFTLKVVLGLLQIGLFAYFFYIGGKLFLYYAAFSIILLLAVSLIVSALLSRDQERT